MRKGANARSRRHQLRQAGWSEPEYARVAEAQGGVCAVCGRPPPDGSVLDADHDHRANKPRGLLCRGCNQALGLLGDDPELIDALAAYVRRHL
jgi:hypothetical protein